MKKTYKIIIPVIILIVVAVLIGQGDYKKSSISIGAVIPQTGFGAYWGKPVLMGIKIAESDLKKKYGEENVSIIIEDGQSSVTASVSAAQKLLTIDKVGGIYSEFSGPSSAISPIARNAGRAFIYSTFNQKIVDDNEYSLKTFISFEVGCEKLASYLKDSSKKVLIISSIGDAAPYCERALLKSFSRNNIKVVDGFIGTDFRTVLLQNKSFEPDIIIPIMYEDGSFALIKQKTELGIKAQIYGYKQDVATQKIINGLANDYTDGIIFFEVLIDQGLYSRAKALYPDITDDDMQGLANAYQSVMLLGDALRQCPNKEMQCVISKVSDGRLLNSPGYEDASIKDRVLQSKMVIKTIKDGKIMVQ